MDQCHGIRPRHVPVGMSLYALFSYTLVSLVQSFSNISGLRKFGVGHFFHLTEYQQEHAVTATTTQYYGLLVNITSHATRQATGGPSHHVHHYRRYASHPKLPGTMNQELSDRYWSGSALRRPVHGQTEAPQDSLPCRPPNSYANGSRSCGSLHRVEHDRIYVHTSSHRQTQ